MATTVQFRRGNTADNNNFTGKLGEITVDTDKWQLRVHDNVTVGGHTISAGTTSSGTVTSVGLSGGTTGLTVATNGSIYSNITASGTFTLAGTLNVTNGGTGTANPVMTATAPLAVTGTWPNVTVALTGTVGTANGGTGVTAAPAANQVLLGTGSGYALTTLVAGNGVTFDQTQNNILTIKSSGGTGSGNTITLADMPPGSIQWFAMQTPPAGWLECNGSILSRTDNSNQYADLWAAIKYTYGGSGDSFKIPDLRGQFLRGWDNGRGVDPGRVFGNLQADAFTSHSHEFDVGQSAGTLSKQLGGWNFVGTYNASSFGTNTFIANTGGTETRPTNVAMIACIKYTAGVATQLVTSVDVSGGTTGLLFSGGPITSTGTITASGILAVANGGTGVSGPNPVFFLQRTAPNYTLLVTNAGVSYPVVWNTIITRQNVDVNTTTGVITITTAGIYHLYASIEYINLRFVPWAGVAIIKGNSQTVAEHYNSTWSDTKYHLSASCSATLYCAAGDTFSAAAGYNVSTVTGGNGDGYGTIEFMYPARNNFGGHRVG